MTQPPAVTTINVALVEDDAATRERFASAILGDPVLKLQHCSSYARDMLEWLHSNNADVLLTDLGLPDLPGVDIIRYCRQHHPATDIMVISMFEDEAHVMQSIEAGATGYLLKDSLSNEIASHIKQLHAGGAPMTPTIARLVLRRMHAAPIPSPAVSAGEHGLTERELQVLNHIARGFKYAEIAQIHGVSTHTVNSHIKNIYSKLSVQSRGEAVFEAARLGLIDSLRTAG
jgi:DNA-binding NarL/FixJ family response regulator